MILLLFFNVSAISNFPKLSIHHVYNQMHSNKSCKYSKARNGGVDEQMFEDFLIFMVLESSSLFPQHYKG